MKYGKVRAYTPLFTAFLLFFSGCAGTLSESLSPAQTLPPAVTASTGTPEEGAGFTLAADFRREDGSALSQGSVRIIIGQDSMDYPLDSEGALRVSGLPRAGSLELTLHDKDGRELASMILTIAGGAVMDASTDEEGVGHLTLKEAAEEVALTFTLGGDGALRCALRLTSAAGL